MSSNPEDIMPFKIDVPKAKLDQLKEKLESAKFPDELEGAGWSLGTPLSDVKSLVEYWRDTYDWNAAQSALNEDLEQYTTTIDLDDGLGSLNVHFIHKKSDHSNALPLMVVHGWPGSFFELKKLVPLLAEEDDGKGPAFDIVMPSLPGYGFSEGFKQSKNIGLQHYGEVCHKLMLKLGYTEYVTYGGDWGMGITRLMGANYGPKYLKGSHYSTVVMDQPKLFSNPIYWLSHKLGSYTNKEKEGDNRTKWFQSNASGYYEVQSTRPQTLGYGLTDSPVALLAWILEKLHDWTDNYPWTKDEILTWVSIYLFSTAGPAASVRTYYFANSNEENKRLLALARDGYIGNIPIGVSLFPKDINVPPKSWRVNMIGRIVFEARHDEGGHFSAYEKPEILANDIKKMYGRGGGAFGLVKGKSGYSES